MRLDAVIVGLDAGGSVVKATAFDAGSGAASTAQRPVGVIHPSPGFNERDPDLLWRSAGEVVREALAGMPDGPRRVAAICVTAHGNGAYLVDSVGRPVRRAIQASDARASEAVERWKRDGVEAALRPQVWNGMWPGQPGPILAWLAEHEPEVLDEASAVLMCGDYLMGRLSGRVVGEVTSWSSNGLLDPASVSVSDASLEAFGIGKYRRVIPSLVPPGSVVGEATREAAQMLGIPEGVAIVAGAVDNVALHVGAGALDGSRVVVGAGTWSINQLLVPVSQMRMDGPLGAVEPTAACLAVPDGQALLIEASATSASAFSWALEQALRGLNVEAAEARQNPFAYALQRLGPMPPPGDAPFFVPHLDGSRDHGSARGAWIGISSADDDVALAGAVVEGICFEHRRHISRLSRALDEPVPLRLAGGAGRSPVWAQLFADVTGSPVEVSPVQELGAVGAVAIGGSAVGVFASLEEALALLNPTQRRFEPHRSSQSRAEERFRRYERVVEALDALEGTG